MPALLDTYHALAARSDGLHARQPAIDFSAVVVDTLQAQPMTKRQQTGIQEGIIPTYYNMSGPKPGTVVGIVLGSVAAFLFIAWLLFTLTNGNATAGGTTTMAGEEEIVVRKRRNSQGRHSRASRRGQEVREVSRSPRQSGGRSQIIVDGRRYSGVDERRHSGRRQRDSIVEERRRVPGDDVVEVIEEHEEYRERRGSRRGGYQ